MLSHSTLLAGIFRFAPSPEAETWATLTARCNPCHPGESPPLALGQDRQAAFRGGSECASVIDVRDPPRNALLRRIKVEEEPGIPHDNPPRADAGRCHPEVWHARDGEYGPRQPVHILRLDRPIEAAPRHVPMPGRLPSETTCAPTPPMAVKRLPWTTSTQPKPVNGCRQ